MEGLKAQIIDNLRLLSHAPGVQMDIFPPGHLIGMYDTDMDKSDDRLNQYIRQHSLLKEDLEDNQFGMR